MSKSTLTPSKKPYQKTAKTPMNKRIEALIDSANNISDMIGVVAFLESSLTYDRDTLILGSKDIQGIKCIINLLIDELSNIESTLTNEIDLQRNAA